MNTKQLFCLETKYSSIKNLKGKTQIIMAHESKVTGDNNRNAISVTYEQFFLLKIYKSSVDVYAAAINKLFYVISHEFQVRMHLLSTFTFKVVIKFM